MEKHRRALAARKRLDVNERCILNILTARLRKHRAQQEQQGHTP